MPGSIFVTTGQTSGSGDLGVLAFSPVAVPDGDVQVPMVTALNVPPRNARLFIMSAALCEAQLFGNLLARRDGSGSKFGMGQ